MNVLIAEDEPVSRRLLENYLAGWGHQVVAAKNGAKAWAQFQAGDFPIVISDWIMPELDGIDLVRRIRASDHATYVYVILLTSKSQKEDVVQGMEAGADDFVTKPFDRDELRVRLRAGERIIHLEHTLAKQNQDLRQAQAAMIQSEKLASLGQLAAGVAHEINNPIAYVTNNIAVIRRDALAALDLLDQYRQGRDRWSEAAPKLAEETAAIETRIDLPYIQKNLGRMLESTAKGLERVRDIVRNLRDFARLDEAEFKDIDINAALETTVEILRHELKQHGIELAMELEPLPPFLGHPSKINQVFLNLLMNAIQACPPAGRITVRTFARDGHLGIEVEDNGSGISPEHLPHIFEPFFTTKPVGQGTGLGLSVSYGIVRDHGGRIEAESEPGTRTRFRVWLPERTEEPS